MFWPVILPFFITAFVMALLVVALTVYAPSLKWKRHKTFFLSAFLACIAFIPSCTGIMFAVDVIRFGQSEYSDFGEVNDFRAERYLPTSAKDIEMYKHANGYQARYNISEADFQAYIDGLWDKYGKHSAIERDRLSDEGMPAKPNDFSRYFSEQNWRPLDNAVVYHSPKEGDGGGAIYFYDGVAGIAFQWTCYW